MIESAPLPKKANRIFTLVTAPSIEPVTVTEMKDYARIDGSDEDTALGSFITAARQASELYTHRAFLEQTWRISYDWWEDMAIELPRPPLISITKVETVDEDGIATLYAASNYYAVTDATPGKIALRIGATPPTNYDRDVAGYRVTYLAGYGSLATYVPELLRLAVKQWAVVIYEERAMTPEPPPNIKVLLDLYKVWN
jgi:uncharacterized phiE125 gp8 family phage protein